MESELYPASAHTQNLHCNGSSPTAYKSVEAWNSVHWIAAAILLLPEVNKGVSQASVGYYENIFHLIYNHNIIGFFTGKLRFVWTKKQDYERFIRQSELTNF